MSDRLGNNEIGNLLRLLKESPIPKLSQYEVTMLGNLGSFLLSRNILKPVGHASFVPCPNEDCVEMAELFYSTDKSRLLRQCLACNEISPSPEGENVEFEWVMGGFLEYLRSEWKMEGKMEILKSNDVWLLGHKGGVSVVLVREPSQAAEEIKKMGDSLFFVPTSQALKAGFYSLDQFISFEDKNLVVLDIQSVLAVVAGKSLTPSANERIVLHENPKIEFERTSNVLFVHSVLKPETKDLGKAAGAILYFLYHSGQPTQYKQYFTKEKIKTLPALERLKDTTVGNAISTLYSVHEKFSVDLPCLLEKSLMKELRLNQALDCVLALKRRRS